MRLIEDPTIEAAAKALASEGIDEIERLMRCGHPWYVAREMVLEERGRLWAKECGSEAANRAVRFILSCDFDDLTLLSDETREYFASQGRVARPVKEFVTWLLINPLLYIGLGLIAWMLYDARPILVPVAVAGMMMVLFAASRAWAIMDHQRRVGY
jgi:hypothetical protein